MSIGRRLQVEFSETTTWRIKGKNLSVEAGKVSN